MSPRMYPALFLAASLFVATASSAQTTRIGPHFGYNSGDELGEFTLGLNGQFGIDTGDREFLVGFAAELLPFMTDWSYTFIDVDLLVPASIGSLDLYGGGGLSVRYRKPKSGEADTDPGLNLKAGLVFASETRGWAPFLEVVQTIGSGTDFTARAGVFFQLGR